MSVIDGKGLLLAFAYASALAQIIAIGAWALVYAVTGENIMQILARGA